MAVVSLLNLDTRMPWLASREENYFLSSSYTPVAFNWMHCMLSSLQTNTGVWPGGLTWPPYPGSEMNAVTPGHSGCYMETFASEKIPEALVPITYQKWGCPRITMGSSLASATDVPGDHRPVFADL